MFPMKFGPECAKNHSVELQGSGWGWDSQPP